MHVSLSTNYKGWSDSRRKSQPYTLIQSTVRGNEIFENRDLSVSRGQTSKILKVSFFGLFLFALIDTDCRGSG